MLSDTRHLVLEVMPAQVREQPMWQHVAGTLIDVAEGGDVLDATLALEIALMLSGVMGRS
jgi:hypothetical protein